MNPLTRTVPMTVVLVVTNPKTGRPDTRLAGTGNVIGVRLKEPSGDTTQITSFTVPRAGRISCTFDTDQVGTHELVARLLLGGQEAATTPFKFRVDPDHYGE